MVHFDEGEVIHHKKGQKRNEEQVIIDPLNVAVASQATTYRLSSADDPAYAQPKSPLRVNRKSKGTDFAWFVDRWEGRAINDRPDHTKEHWIYLALPAPLQPGKSYSLSLGELGETQKFRFDLAKSRSEAVHVNLVGYVPTAPEKFGYVYHWMGDGGSLDLKAWEGKSFWLVDTKTGARAFEGKVAFRKPRTTQETFHKSDTPPDGNFSFADVWQCDFSAFRTPGDYVLSVDGIGCSFPFKIGDDVYREPFYHVIRGLYHNRSGIALTKPFTEYERPAPHNPALTPGFKGKLMYTTIPYYRWGSEGGDKAALEAAFKGSLDAWGWYQDAGDWDSYVTHLRPAQELLLAYQMRPENFTDGELNLPESGNGVPDILDEAAWLPRFCHRLRHELMRKGWGTGGVGLRVAGDAFGGDGEGVPSYLDVDRIWAASGEDPISTFRYAGVAAMLARFIEEDPQGVDWEAEARESYAWALRHESDASADDLGPHKAYAAAALFRLTGENGFEQDLAATLGTVSPTTEFWFESAYAPAVYLLGGKGTASAEIEGNLRAAMIHTAKLSLNSAETRSMRWGGLWQFPMLVGHQTTPWVLEMAIGHEVTDDPALAKRFLGALYTTADYFLGTNSLNMTWITGVGERYPAHIFHMDAWYNGKDSYHPGLIPYGQWRKEKELGDGPWDQAWAHSTVYPAGIDNWPGNERWFSNRCSPMHAEFTVHQQSGPAAALFGLLCASKR